MSFLAATVLLAVTQTATTPTQVRLAYGEDPTSMMSVVWQTQDELQSPTVEFGISGNLGKSVSATRATYTYETGKIYEAKLQGLSPNTSYYYRVGSKSGGWSRSYSFKTAEKNPESFFFTAFGDHGVTIESVKSVRNVLRESPAFHALLGDVSYANGNQPVWDNYLNQIEPLAARIPFMLTLGNHENEKKTIDGKEVKIGYASYLARFALPKPEERYTFDYGNARFVAFNSDDYKNEAQLKWLREVLSAARKDSGVKWIIVFQHHPPYGSSKGRGDNQGLIATVTPIYDEFKVDLVLSGHDHHYERQYPMRSGKPTSSAMTGYKKGEGTLYIVQGGGGQSLYDFIDPKPEICALREKSHGYLKVTVPKKGPLNIESKRNDGSMIERIEILE